MPFRYSSGNIYHYLPASKAKALEIGNGTKAGFVLVVKRLAVECQLSAPGFSLNKLFFQCFMKATAERCVIIADNNDFYWTLTKSSCYISRE
ncbi:MAG: hypothetical protein DRH04_00885 [Deltaproteobacteria bacterium]|nr:MAG: hypothetical protein DRH04_00885 [Deltaproteobacteria bacterium]